MRQGYCFDGGRVEKQKEGEYGCVREEEEDKEEKEWVSG